MVGMLKPKVRKHVLEDTTATLSLVIEAAGYMCHHVGFCRCHLSPHQTHLGILAYKAYY